MPLQNRYQAALLKKKLCMGTAYWPRISETLALRLNNAFLARSAHVPTWQILDELQWLEQAPGAKPTSTKPAAQLTGPVLGRFMHKHYTSGAFLVQNLANQWFGPFATKHQLVGRELRRILDASGDVPLSEQAEKLAGHIVHTLVVDGTKRRREGKRMTGEWIIYYVHRGQNYYLDVAFHDETETPVGELALLERLKDSCEWEFPFAFVR